MLRAIVSWMESNAAAPKVDASRIYLVGFSYGGDGVYALANHMRMAAGYYAEPMAALLLAMGLNAVKRGRSTRGWALVGVATLFRLECLVLAAALLLCGGVCRESGKNDLKWWLRAALCLSPGVVRNVFAMLHGAHVQGFDFFSFPSPRRICVAAESAFASVLLLRNGLLPVCLSALIAVISVTHVSVTHGERLLAKKGLAACFVALLAGVALLGFNESAHYAWIVDNVMPRFVWLCALPLLVSDGHWFSGGGIQRGQRGDFISLKF